MDFSKLTAYIDSLKEGYGIPGVDVQVMRDHEVVYRHMTGCIDYAGEKPVSRDSLYDIYSCSKVMTMIAVMQLVEQGKLRLEDPLELYIPEFGQLTRARDFIVDEPPYVWPTMDAPRVPVENKIYIHQLMSMTAGLSYDTPTLATFAKPGAGTVELIRCLAKMPLLYEPGTRYIYSLAHDVLAAVVEVVSGMRFRDYMKENVFDPVEAEEMYYHIPAQVKDRVCDQYTLDAKTGKLLPTAGLPFRLTAEYDSGGAGLTASVESYAKVIDALACGGVGATGKRLLSPESIETMRKDWLGPTQLEDFRKLGKNGYSYGLGVRTLIEADTSRGPLGEFGWDGAAGAYCVIDPKNKLSIFYVHEILEMPIAYSEIHPKVRDLVYETLGL